MKKIEIKFENQLNKNLRELKIKNDKFDFYI